MYAIRFIVGDAASCCSSPVDDDAVIAEAGEEEAVPEQNVTKKHWGSITLQKNTGGRTGCT